MSWNSKMILLRSYREGLYYSAGSWGDYQGALQVSLRIWTIGLITMGKFC